MPSRALCADIDCALLCYVHESKYTQYIQIFASRISVKMWLPRVASLSWKHCTFSKAFGQQLIYSTVHVYCVFIWPSTLSLLIYCIYLTLQFPILLRFKLLYLIMSLHTESQCRCLARTIGDYTVIETWVLRLRKAWKKIRKSLK